MRLPLRLLPSPRARGTLTIRCFASSSIPPYGRTASYRRICGKLGDNPTLFSPFPESRINFITSRPHILAWLLRYTLPTTSRSFTASAFRLGGRTQCGTPTDPPRTKYTSSGKTGSGTARETSPNESEGSGNAKGASTGNPEEPSEKADQSSEDTQNESSKRSDKEGKRKEETPPPPPPPPHGDKSPWQVFRETLTQEFQASKEWNESTKALASSAHQFTENESVRRAKAAYNAASGAATSTTSSALKGTGKVLGQGAAWTWDTPVVKGVRSGVKATGRGIEKATRPVRETNVYKTTIGGVKEVIDDGSSSRYGGWVEKEERRKQRELRELNEAAVNGRTGKAGEKIEEDPKSVIMPHSSHPPFQTNRIL